MHPRAMWHSVYLLDYPVIGRFFTTTRAGSTGASKPDVFRMGAFFVLTMQLFTAQSWLAAGEHFSHFNDFDISKRWLSRHYILPGFVVLKEEVKWSRLIGCINRSTSSHGR
ncbi:hypothetical protein BCU27_08765 [Vibrio sp. 10N.286.45.B6]|nr:hypothetical protein BCU27_08765 [Vibrio sp. 10N.286.45.B6]